MSATPFRLLPIAAAIALMAGSAAAQVAPAAPAPVTERGWAPALKMERLLGAGRSAQSVEGVSFARAARVSGDAQDELTLEGNAEVRANGAVLRGDRIMYTYSDDLLRVRGNARAFRDGGLFSGPAIDVRLEAQTGSMPDAQFSYGAIGANGRAREVQFMGPELTRLLKAEYTTCTPEDRAWWVQAERLDIDRVDEVATARGAKLYFQDIPVFASPYFEFPLGDRRRSGVLTPSFGINSRLGWETTVPYYIDIAPNRDATIEPRFMSRRGVMFQNEFRYLEPTVRGEIQYDVLGNDRDFGGRSRELISTQHVWNGRSGFGAGLNYNRVSDDQYFIDFGRNLVEGSTSVLPQDGFVSYTQPYWNTAVRVTKNQTLQDPLAPVTKPYERVPQVTLGASRLDWGGFDLSMTAEVSQFEHPSLVNGRRYTVNPVVSYPLLAPGWFVVPKMQWHSTRYELGDAFRTTSAQRSRDLPIGSLDAGLVFERGARWFGDDVTQTLEPRLFYSRVPYQEQNDLPNFDSALADFNFAQLFNENVFVGGDRIAEANQLTVGLVGRVLDAETGGERLRAAVGQRYYYSPQRVTLPGGVGRRDENSSDLLFGLSGLIVRGWTAALSLQHSTTENQVVRATAGLRYQPRPASVINLAYRYKLRELQQVDLAVQWPISNRWYGVARGNWSARENRFVEAIGGVEYKADCWVLRLAAQRFVTATQEATTQVFFAIELNGLGNVGSSPIEQLRRNIPGYQLINPPPREPGRFDYYE